MRVLIVGATGDLGGVVARRLAASEHEVVLHGYSSLDKLESLAVETLAASTLVFDVRDEEAVSASLKSLERLDGLVYCSAVNPTAARIEELSSKTWREILDVNSTGAFICLKHALPLLRRGKDPSVVMVSSIFGLETPARRSAYGASKHAIHALVQACVREEGAWLRANAVCPGPMWSENLRRILEKHANAANLALEDYVLSRVNDVPAGRFMDLSECAAAIEFLLSSQSSFVSGEFLRVSGGAIQ